MPALAKYCLECGIKHLVPDCSLNQDKKGKATLNLLETIASSSGNESEDVKSVKIVTRAQTLKDVAQQTDGEEKSLTSSPSTWKARRQRRMAAKKCKEEKALDKQKSQEAKSAPQGGSVLADKVFEPLKTMLDLYEARLRSNQTNEERYRAYPNPELETKRLEVFQKMIEGTQALLEKQMEK